jgi:2,2-dialkylglycine decarboxylase (pyruvate)
MVTSAAIEETCYERGFVHVTSHVSDPLPAAVGLAVLEVLRRERLAERALELGRRLEAGLARSASALRGDRRRARARPAVGRGAGD